MAITPVFLPGEFHGQRSLVIYSPWGCKGSDMTVSMHSLAVLACKVERFMGLLGASNTVVYGRKIL